MTIQDDVIQSLQKEILFQKINYERELTNLRFDNNNIALKLQAAETERRLEVLNHAHDALESDRATKLNITVFEQFLKDYTTRNDESVKWKETMTAKVSAVQSQVATWIIFLGLSLSALSIGMGVIGMIVAVILHFIK